MQVVLDILHAVQACLSAYALYLAYISITDSRKYEEKTQKAAQYSNTAKQQLHKTRTTLAGGTAARGTRLTSTTAPTPHFNDEKSANTAAHILTQALFSFITSINPLFLTSNPTWPKVFFNVLNVVTTLSARAHVSNFWRAKAKVPFVDHYNEAITTTNRLKIQLAYLAGTWAVSSAMGLWVLL